jgi:hypothetical protein
MAVMVTAAQWVHTNTHQVLSDGTPSEASKGVWTLVVDGRTIGSCWAVIGTWSAVLDGGTDAKLCDTRKDAYRYLWGHR